MSALWAILAMAGGVYALRLAGLSVRDVEVPEVWERALAFVPVALLASLVAASLAGASGGGDAQVAAAVGAGLVAWRTRRMWACILSGMSIFWLLTLIEHVL